MAFMFSDLTDYQMSDLMQVMLQMERLVHQPCSKKDMYNSYWFDSKGRYHQFFKVIY